MSGNAILSGGSWTILMAARKHNAEVAVTQAAKLPHACGWHWCAVCACVHRLTAYSMCIETNITSLTHSSVNSVHHTPVCPHRLDSHWHDMLQGIRASTLPMNTCLRQFVASDCAHDSCYWCLAMECTRCWTLQGYWVRRHLQYPDHSQPDSNLPSIFFKSTLCLPGEAV